MLTKQSKIKLDKYMLARKRNPTRMIYIIYRHFNEWAQKQWQQDGWGEMRPEHLRLISIIGVEPVNNNELAMRARVSKQAMSKMVKDLLNMGFVNMEADPNDSRAKIISISNKGVDFLVYLGNCKKIFEAKFQNILGRKKTDALIELLSELTEGILEEEKAQYWKK